MKTITQNIAKKIIYLFSFFCFLNANAQALPPEKFSFQAVVRNSSNQLIANQNIGLRISILSVVMGSENAEFIETHTATTNQNGLFSIQVGSGTIVSGELSNALNSSAQSKKIKCEIDPTGGTNYTIVSNEQLLSVPYALEAKKTSGINAMSQADRDALTPSIGAVILNTNTGKPNFYNGTEWLNFDGSSAITTLALSTEKQINSFDFLKQDNPALAQDVSGIVNVQDQTITFLFPANTAVNQLKPNYAISPKSILLLNNVLLNNTTIINGTLNNTVIIQAEDKSIVNYALKFNFSPLKSSNTRFPKMCVLYQKSVAGSQPFDTIFYSYNAKDKLIKYKTKSIYYEFEYINDTIVSQRRGYYTSSKQLFESYDYKYQDSNISSNILSISPSNGIGSVTNFWYTGGQIQRFNVSYYDAIKEEHTTTQDSFSRVSTDNYWVLNAQNTKLLYTNSWTYFDAIYDPNPLIGLRIATNDYSYNLLKNKAYAIKSHVYDNSRNSPYGSLTSTYSYTTNASKYIIKQLDASGDTVLEYLYE
jgi:hypothetical protein